VATIEEGIVFEYCEKLYREIEAHDGGYYPSKHESYSYTEVAAHFKISENEVSRIYNKYNKQATDIEVEKINKLPPPLRKKAMEKRVRGILLNNRDLPFYKQEGSPSVELPEALEVLNSEYHKSVETIANCGWTIPLDIDVKRFNELLSILNDDVAIDKYFTEYYSKRLVRLICRKISKAIEIEAQKVKFNECINAYEKGMYSVCLTTLITILEGFIFLFCDQPNDTRVMRICKFHADEEMKRKNNIRGLCWLSMYEYTKVLYQKSDFTQPEPIKLNRHWLQHGRTEKTVEKTDCIRVLNALSTLVIIKQADNALTS